MYSGFTGKVFVLSDAHLGSRHSLVTPEKFLTEDNLEKSAVTPQQRQEMIRALEVTIDRPDIHIISISGDFWDMYENATRKLNEGDIQTEHPLSEETIEYAIKTIKRWAQKNPEKIFYADDGNHDGNPNRPFRGKLIELSQELPNLHHSDYGVLIGDTLITHGDFAEREGGVDTRQDPFGSRYDMTYDAMRDNQYMYEWYEKFLSNPDNASQFIILRHNAEPSSLSLEEYQNSNIVFGHTHGGVIIERPNGKVVINAASLQHRPDFGDEYSLATPAQLQQPILNFEDGVLDTKNIEFAFPDAIVWEGYSEKLQGIDNQKGQTP